MTRVVLPEYVALPADLIFGDRLPARLVVLYQKLLGLAWIHDYEWFEYRTEDVAQVLRMNPETLRRYVKYLAGRGYLRRERTGSRRWRTWFLVRWSVREGAAHADSVAHGGSAGTGTPPASGYALGEETVDRPETPTTQEHQHVSKPHAGLREEGDATTVLSGTGGPPGSAVGGAGGRCEKGASGTGSPPDIVVGGAGGPPETAVGETGSTPQSGLSRTGGPPESGDHGDVVHGEDRNILTNGQQHHHSYQALCAIGVRPDVALELAGKCDAERVDGWVEYAILQEEWLGNPAGLVVRMLRVGKAPPELTPDQENALERKLLRWELAGRCVWGE